MCRTLSLLLCIGIALPGFAAKRVTVRQLEQLIDSVHGKQDADVAGRLSQVELAERLSPAKASLLEKSMPGPMSRDAVIVLADASVFHSLPAAEVPTTAVPDSIEQQRLLDLATNYAGQTLSQLPNFFATQETTLYMDALPGPGKIAVPADQSMQYAREFRATVFYRDGKQVMETGAEKGKESQAHPAGLITSGEFGPILATVLADGRHGQLAWSHWEHGDGGQEAVFRYAVPRDKSHYEAGFCCVFVNSGSKVFKRLSGYHGEIAIDPQTGTILRLTMQADIKPAYPMTRADLMVEYGPVEIGGKTYTCPVKSVAIARGYERLKGNSDSEPLNFQGSLASSGTTPDERRDAPEVLQTMLNHVVYRQYHLFRSESRILTESGEELETSPPGANATPATPPQ